MKRTRRNNRRLKGGTGSNKKSPIRKTSKSSAQRKGTKKVSFPSLDTHAIDIDLDSFVINVKPDPTKSGPSILKVKKSKLPDGNLPRPDNTIFTGINQSQKYDLGRYDKTSRCKETGKKACEIENEKIRKSKSKSKSKGGKKTLKKRKRKMNKK